eukprot:g8467.t1
MMLGILVLAGVLFSGAPDAAAASEYTAPPAADEELGQSGAGPVAQFSGAPDAGVPRADSDLAASLAADNASDGAGPRAQFNRTASAGAAGTGADPAAPFAARNDAGRRVPSSVQAPDARTAWGAGVPAAESDGADGAGLGVQFNRSHPGFVFFEKPDASGTVPAVHSDPRKRIDVAAAFSAPRTREAAAMAAKEEATFASPGREDARLPDAGGKDARVDELCPAGRASVHKETAKANIGRMYMVEIDANINTTEGTMPPVPSLPSGRCCVGRHSDQSIAQESWEFLLATDFSCRAEERKHAPDSMALRCSIIGRVLLAVPRYYLPAIVDVDDEYVSLVEKKIAERVLVFLGIPAEALPDGWEQERVAFSTFTGFRRPGAEARRARENHLLAWSAGSIRCDASLWDVSFPEENPGRMVPPASRRRLQAPHLRMLGRRPAPGPPTPGRAHCHVVIEERRWIHAQFGTTGALEVTGGLFELVDPKTESLLRRAWLAVASVEKWGQADSLVLWGLPDLWDRNFDAAYVQNLLWKFAIKAQRRGAEIVFPRGAFPGKLANSRDEATETRVVDVVDPWWEWADFEEPEEAQVPQTVHEWRAVCDSEEERNSLLAIATGVRVLRCKLCGGELNTEHMRIVCRPGAVTYNANGGLASWAGLKKVAQARGLQPGGT